MRRHLDRPPRRTLHELDFAMNCAVSDCDSPVKQRGWCSTHYFRWYRNGDPLFVTPRPDRLDRFWSKVQRAPSGHWIWTGAKDAKGYGRMYDSPGSSPQVIYAHRYSYRQFVGPITPGLVIDHLCRMTSCVNPQHLDQVTNQVNVIRGTARAAKRGLTHCPNGHPYSGENLFLQAGSGARLCRECNRAHNRSYYWRQKEVVR